MPAMNSQHRLDYDYLRHEGEYDDGAELCSVWCAACRRWELVWVDQERLTRDSANDNANVNDDTEGE